MIHPFKRDLLLLYNKRSNSGTLRANSGEDAVENQPNVISCINIVDGGINSCTFSATTTPTRQTGSLVTDGKPIEIHLQQLTH